jgi:hypothetical protein
LFTKHHEKSRNKRKKLDFFCCLTIQSIFLHIARFACLPQCIFKTVNALFYRNKARVRAIIQKPKSGMLKARIPLFFNSPKGKGNSPNG